MNRCFRLALAVSAAMVLQGCDNGYNIPREDPNYAGAERTCAEAPVNANATESAVAVYNLLLRLSCTRASEGIMMGQVVGSGTVIDERSEDNSYYQLFTEFNDEFNQLPSLMTVDYGQHRHTRETLTRVNERINHEDSETPAGQTPLFITHLVAFLSCSHRHLLQGINLIFVTSAILGILTSIVGGPLTETGRYPTNPPPGSSTSVPG